MSGKRLYMYMSLSRFARFAPIVLTSLLFHQGCADSGYAAKRTGQSTQAVIDDDDGGDGDGGDGDGGDGDGGGGDPGGGDPGGGPSDPDPCDGDCGPDDDPSIEIKTSSIGGVACRAVCWAAGGAACGAISAACTAGTVATVGGLAIPCTAAIIAGCAAAGAASSVCSDVVCDA